MNKIPVFFCEEMVVLKDLVSPSPKKPKQLVEQWKSLFPIEIKTVEPVTIEEISCVHDVNFVQAIMNGKRRNGFNTKDIEVSNSLPYTNGSFLSAAREAINNGLVAVSPTSGFHHANYNKAMGFCTFNGLMVAAYQLLYNNEVNKIGILDCDHHYGNGTDMIINKLDLDNSILHITARKDYEYDAIKFFNLLPKFLESFLNVDIVFYQAGADCHINDPYGGFLTTEQMQERDRIVFTFCKTHKIPLVWNLAGGYQEEILPDGTRNMQKVLDLHNNTMQECINIYLK